MRAPHANVVLLSVDTWRADHLSLYGYGRATTPGLEQLATDAIVFDRAFSAAPQTAPSHMSMLTGVPPLVHGVVNPDATKGLRTLAPSIHTLAETFKAHGYRTAGFTASGNVRRLFGFARGFDQFHEDRVGGMNGNGPYSLDPQGVTWWLAQARTRPEPFFLFLHTYVPHTPYLPPPPYDTRYDPDYRGAIPSNRAAFFRQLPATRGPIEVSAFFEFFRHVDKQSPADIRHLIALYDGECNAADDAIVAIRRAIADAGVADRTIFILTSDHGEEFLEHGALIHPGELWDELLHVPLVVTTPAGRGDGRHIAAPVGGLDIVPTILDLVGLPPDPQALGRSLVPLMQSDPTWTDRPVLSEFLGGAASAPQVPEAMQSLRSLRTGRHKLIRRFGAHPSDELYDLEVDPGEHRNVVDDPNAASVLARLRTTSDTIDRMEASLRAPGTEVPLSESTLSELRALGYVR